MQSRTAKSGSHLERHRKWWSVGLIASGSIAATTGISGLVLAGASLIAPLHVRGGTVSAILLAATFPLLIIAAHCLDQIDELNRTFREAKNHGVDHKGSLGARIHETK